MFLRQPSKENDTNLTVRLSIRYILTFAIAVAGLLPVAAIPVPSQKAPVEEIHNSLYYSSRAEDLLNQNSYESAKREIDEGLKHYPDDPELLYLNGKYYYDAHRDLQKARYNLVKALQESDQHWGARRTLIDVEDDSKHFSSAICYINELLEQQPYDRDLWRRKIALYNKMGNKVEAEAALERLSRIYPNDSVVKRDLSLLHRQNWNQRLSATTLAERAATLEGWVNTDPDAFDYYQELSDVYIKMGDYDKALAAAKRGLVRFPGNAWLVQRAANLMSEQGLYTRALMYLKEHRVGGNAYYNTMREAANDARLRDAYDIHGRLYAETGDKDALTYLLNTALTRGYYDDALEYLREAYRLEGRTVDLLMKEYELQKRNGNDNQARRLLRELFSINPFDEDIREEYIAMQLQLATIDEEQHDWQGAYDLLTVATSNMPVGSEQWTAAMSRRILLLGQMNKTDDAMSLANEASMLDPEHRARYIAAYEDDVAKKIKQLIEDERYYEALDLAEQLITANPDSETGLRTAINMTQTLKHTNEFYKYAQMGYDLYPDQPYFAIKEAVALQQQKRYGDAVHILTPQKNGDVYPMVQLINPYCGVIEDFATLLIKEHMPEIAIERIDQALYYDPENKGLKYLKGIAYEQLKDYRKAYDLQTANYNPTNAEQSEWEEHMRYLRYRSFDNHIDISYTAAYYDTRSEDLASVGHLYSLASIGYWHKWKNTTLGATINYKATDGYMMLGEYSKGGSALEGILSWEQLLKYNWTMNLSGSVGGQYFNRFGLNFSLSKALDKGWNVGGKLSYRYTQPLLIYNGKDGWRGTEKSRNLVMIGPRASKEWERVGLHLAVDAITLDFSNFYYNATLMGKFFIKDDGVTSISALAGVGSFPELEFFDQFTMNGITNMNAMVGIAGAFLVTKNLILTVAGNWNTYYNPKFTNDGTAHDSYRNIYSVTGGLNIVF